MTALGARIFLRGCERKGTEMTEEQIDYSLYFRILKQIYEEGLPFNKLIGMKVVELNFENNDSSVGTRVDSRYRQAKTDA